jgi:hypothetical protein
MKNGSIRAGETNLNPGNSENSPLEVFETLISRGLKSEARVITSRVNGSVVGVWGTSKKDSVRNKE